MTDVQVLTAVGRNGQVSFDGRMVTITRGGVIGRVTHGRGTKVLPVSRITGVQLKPYSLMGWGFIEFTVPGGLERQSRLGKQAADAAKNENAVTFGRKSQAAFEALQAAVMGAL